MTNRRPLFLLFTANAISGFAQGISLLAIPWYFAKTQQSGLFTIAYGCITILILFFGLYAGTLVDKFSRKKNFMGINLLCGIIIFSISLWGYINHSLPNIFIIGVFGITLLNFNIHYPTLYAFVHEITEPHQYQKVNSWIEIVGQSTSVLSGALAALLIEGVSNSSGKIAGIPIHIPFEIKRWEIWEICMADAATYFVAVALIAFIKYVKIKDIPLEAGSILKRIKTGFSYLKNHPALLVFGLFSYSVFATLLVSIHSLLPIYVERHLNEEGSVFAAADLVYAMGALCAGLFVSKVFKKSNSIKSIIILTLLATILFMWMYFAKSVIVLYVFCLLLGFSNAGIRVLRLTYFFNHIPNELMGRVNSIFNMANVFIRIVFIFLFSLPFFTFGNQVIWAFFIMSIFLGVSAFILVVNRKKLID
ncbi:MAG: MFS transporter [Bacteroidia bacterium]|nr:MFS transporter [Bacteroidia bacterium]